MHLNNNTNRHFNVFIDGRLAEIHDASNVCDWQYCPTLLNPADVGKCVVFPKSKNKFLSWVEGPTFLHVPKSEWPIFSRKAASVVNLSALFSIPVNVKHVLKSENFALGERFLPLVSNYSDFD